VEGLSILALILLSFFGYSAGAVLAAGKSAVPRPAIVDLVLVVFVWAGAIYSRLGYSINKWLLILVWLALGCFIGAIAALFQKRALRKQIVASCIPSSDGGPNAGISPWGRWKAFSLRLGGFQSRVWLSLFYFIFISPAAIIVKAFSDPLGIKKCGRESHWLSKKETGSDLSQYRNQF
jgi:hypothetical protein